MLNAGVVAPGMPATTLTPEQQRAAQEVDAARTSHLFAATAPEAAGSGTQVTPPAPGSAAVADTGDHKLGFLKGPVDRDTLNPDHLLPVAGTAILQAGSVIPAALITGLRSDLPGEVAAQITQAIFDSPTGKILLIPQGAKLIGSYDAQVTFGQSRALLVWTRLIMPDGRSVVLPRSPAVDGAGYAGVEDEVDNHWGALFEAAALSTILSVGSEAGTSNDANTLAQAIRQGASQSFSQVGSQVVGRALNVQPTITIRPGYPVNVLVTRDLVLAPYNS
jgi:type IV secretion system protein VirB10